MGAALVLKGNKVKGEVFAFDALRCDNLHALACYSGRQFCDKGRIKTDNGIPVKTPAGEFSILQMDQEVHFWATICKKKRLTMKAVCGAFGHSKLIELLDIQEPIRLSITECSDVSTTQILTTEDGRQIRVAKGTKAMYKYLDTGEVTLSEGNVACEGGELKIGVEYQVMTVKVTEAKGRLKTNEGILPAACTLAYGGCALEDMTLVIDTGKVNRCWYVEVRKAEFQRFQYGGKKLLISDEHKILLEEGEEEPLPTDCLGRGAMRKTNFARLFI